MANGGWQRPALRWTAIGVGVVVAVHAIAGIGLLLMQRSYADEVLPGVTIDGQDVSGLDRDTLDATAEEDVAQRLTAAVEVEAGELSLTTDRSELGVRYPVDEAVESAWSYGREGFYTALRQHLDARRGAEFAVPMDAQLDEEQLSAWADEAATELSQEERSAGLEFVVVDAPDDVEVEVTEPIQGQQVAAGDLADEVRAELVEAHDEVTVLQVQVEPEQVDAPPVTAADLDAAVPVAEVVVSASVTLVAPESGQEGADEIVLTPADLAEVISVERDDEAPEGQRLTFVGEPARVEDLIGQDAAELATDPVEATFEVVDGEVVIDGGTPGFTPDLEEATTRIVELATEAEPRQGEFPGELNDPDWTLDEAQELGIDEAVSSFTTDLVPGQPRNTNLQLAAEYVDGALLLPGEQLSLNEAIGERTTDRGFVENGFIDEDGELVSVLGGGVSQMATTFMNAAWFAGIELVDFQPHSLYFERYPMGREATLFWGAIDVVVENDSPYGILVTSEASESELTVTFWSTPWAQVESQTSEPFDVEEGEVRDGFTVEFGRTITYPDGSTETEEYVHRYVPEDEPEDDDEDEGDD